MTRALASGLTLAVVALVAAVLLLDSSRLVPLTDSVGVLALVLVAGTVVVVRGVEDLGLGLLGLAVLAATWNGVSPGGLPLAHLCLAGSLLVLAPLAVGRGRELRVPVWVWALGAGIVVVAVASVVAPTDRSYLAGRFEVPVEAVIAAQIPDAAVGDVLNAVRWIIPAVALPLAACLALADQARRSERTRLLAAVWAIGATVNAFVALTDEAGLTSVSAHLIPVVDVGGRQAGLTAQPNHLALAIALAAPITVWLLLRSTGAVRAGWCAALVVLAGGLVVSQSRGGLVVAVLGASAALIAQPAGRRLVAPVVTAAVVVGTLLVAFTPHLLDAAGTTLRLSGAQSAQDSNAIRDQIRAQALADIAHSPLRGIGLHVVAEGHAIYLQLAAAGGAVLVLAFAITVLGAVVDGVAVARRAARDERGRDERGLVVVLLISIASWLVVGAVENQIADLYLYLPVALLAGLTVAGRSPASLPVRIPALARIPSSEETR
jgi:hypothetical protein